jgi:branched-chain amino acid transport system substrate-binding protein
MAAILTRRFVVGGIGAGLFLRTRRAWAERQYGPGVTDAEIKLGTTAPYSGPASAYGLYGQSGVGCGARNSAPSQYFWRDSR